MNLFNAIDLISFHLKLKADLNPFDFEENEWRVI